MSYHSRRRQKRYPKTTFGAIYSSVSRQCIYFFAAAAAALYFIFVLPRDNIVVSGNGNYMVSLSLDDPLKFTFHAIPFLIGMGIGALFALIPAALMYHYSGNRRFKMNFIEFNRVISRWQLYFALPLAFLSAILMPMLTGGALTPKVFVERRSFRPFRKYMTASGIIGASLGFIIGTVIGLLVVLFRVIIKGGVLPSIDEGRLMLVTDVSIKRNSDQPVEYAVFCENECGVEKKYYMSQLEFVCRNKEDQLKKGEFVLEREGKIHYAAEQFADYEDRFEQLVANAKAEGRYAGKELKPLTAEAKAAARLERQEDEEFERLLRQKRIEEDDNE